ncbi:MAG: hypothetical protein AB8B96_19130 [Lysobacterales bacterium]
MLRLSHVLLLCVAISTLSATAPATAQSSLEEQMSGDEFRRSGLEKLSAEELKFLNQWLRDDQRQGNPPNRNVTAPSAPAAPAPAPTLADQRGLRPKEASRSTIEARIDGEFTGWSGKTRFKLDNGMIWQQVGSGSQRARSDSPKVTIEPKSLGSWKLYVEGVGRSVKVKRIK